MTFPKAIRIVEVSPRDGLQNEAKIVPTAIKIELIGRLADAGLTAIEAGSFVSPKWVPQMADSAAVLAALPARPGLRYPVLVPNLKGYQDAMAAGAREIAVFAAASESFSRRNINCSIAESLDRFRPVLDAAQIAGIVVRGYVSCALGCPYEGVVAPERVADLAATLAAMGCGEISLGDTIGTGTPLGARRMIAAVAERVPVERLAVHFHDTYGQALANILMALEMGIGIVDSAIGGLGGCPYADGAAGNVATEDVVYMLHGMGIATGIDFDSLLETGWWIADHLGRRPISRTSLAMRAQHERRATIGAT